MDGKIVTCVCLEKLDGKEQTVEKIRDLISKEVPEYYMPQRIFFLDHEEMMEVRDSENPSYLIYRRCSISSIYKEPRNKYEFVLCTIFCNILKVSKVGINDNFFDLGGNFSMAALLVEEIRNAFRTDVPVSFILRTDLTVAQLANQLYAYRMLKYDSKKIEQTIGEILY